MKNKISRRNFVGSTALAAAALATSSDLAARAPEFSSADDPSPIRLGLASYTFRNFGRAQLIGFMKQLKMTELNAKDVKDHLPADPQAESVALSDYAAAGIKLHAAGTIYFQKNEEQDIRTKFEYGRRAGIPVIVAGDPTPETLPRIERFARDYDVQIAIHNHGPEDALWRSPLDALQAVKNMDARLGCCIDVGHTARTGTDVVQAIHQVGPRLFNLHMKDLASFENKDSQVAVGEGIMPVRKIFEALKAIRYKGFVDLEYEIDADDPLPGVLSSFAYMRGVLSGMGYASRGEAL